MIILIIQADKMVVPLLGARVTTALAGILHGTWGVSVKLVFLLKSEVQCRNTKRKRCPQRDFYQDPSDYKTDALTTTLFCHLSHRQLSLPHKLLSNFKAHEDAKKHQKE